MSTSIVSRTISSVEDHRIVLGNSQIARSFDIGTTWSTLRIALRLSMNNIGGSITSTPKFFVGLASGKTNLYFDATTTHAAGVVSYSAAWTYGAGPPPTYGSWFIRPSKRINTTETTGSAVAQALFLADASNAAGYRMLYFVDVIKGSPNYSFRVFLRNAVGTNDISLAQFLTFSEQATPVVTGYAQGTQTLAVDEAVNGTLDHVNIGWDRTTPTIEISDMAVARLA